MDDDAQIEQWSQAWRRVTDLVTAGAERTVPACPDWTVRDLLAHMVGLVADVLDGDEPDDHNPEWTQAQVDRRADKDVAALLAERAALAEPMVAWMRANNPRPMRDVVIHEQDLRGALEAPGAQDTPALAMLRDLFAARVGEGLDDDLPPLALVGERWSWCSSGAVDDAAVVVRASDFDLARAVLSRRSAAQLRSWTTRGDVTPYLPAFEVLGGLPQHDLVEG